MKSKAEIEAYFEWLVKAAETNKREYEAGNIDHELFAEISNIIVGKMEVLLWVLKI